MEVIIKLKMLRACTIQCVYICLLKDEEYCYIVKGQKLISPTQIRFQMNLTTFLTHLSTKSELKHFVSWTSIWCKMTQWHSSKTVFSLSTYWKTCPTEPFFFFFEIMSYGTLVVKDLTFQYVQREHGFLSRVQVSIVTKLIS